MENSLIPSPDEMSTIQSIAKTAADSKYFEKIGGMAGLQAILLYARELGLPLMTCLFGGIRPVLGKMELAPQMMNAMIRKAGHSLNTKVHTNEQCSIHGKRKDSGEEMTVSFSIEDAKRAKIYKGAWETYPKNMLYKTCLSNLAKWLFPDVIGMSYVEDEIQPMENLPPKATVDIEVAKEEPKKAKTEPAKEIVNVPNLINDDKVKNLAFIIGDDERLLDLLLVKCQVQALDEIPEDKYQIAVEWLNKKLDEKLIASMQGEVK